MVKVTGVCPGSAAEHSGVRAGDILESVNNNPISDVLDYRFYLTERVVALRFLRDGESYTVNVHKGEYDDVGLEFETPLMDKKHSCKNGCIFCFIDQNPQGMRDSIYFKDDDSRLSFLHGNYITLTNMTDADVDRIVKMRFSPLNISVHTTNPELRVKMMKNRRAGEVLRYLDVFRDAGLSMCGQIVLCRGINDGAELLRTMRDLAKLAPEMGSVSVVPAGLTKHRDGLYPLTDFTPDEAREVIRSVETFADEMLARTGSRVFFAADEFYLKAGLPMPPEENYEGYPQIENGVGMIRSFTEEFDAALRMADEPSAPRTVSVVTGVASYDMMQELCRKAMDKYSNLQINIYKIINHFFGETITVSGLLTGRDIADQLAGAALGDELLIPQNALRSGEEVFLCGMTVHELSDKLGVPVRASGSDGFEFCDALLGQG